ncbi:hypothetical protein LPJ61_002680 [Coemansia biformis]|uniref:DASH complex subunit DAD1 n=1 Tax=Coemansia biformis TaxID=1286918 RepID=A0A9W8CYF5_9FUNG|nr:hypothetical protein LPJ61_002680 [Coemansia biformis]
MDRTETLPTATHGSRSQFEREKERLIVDINQGMDIVNRNLAQLNQNLESAISLGANFDRVARLWSEFGMIINPPADDEGNVGNSVDGDDADEDDADMGSQTGNGEGTTEGADETFLMDEDE